MRRLTSWLLPSATCLLFLANASAQEQLQQPVPAAPAISDADAAAEACCDGFDWTKNPPVDKHPRPGVFTIPPAGPAYYSVVDLIRGDYREGPPKYPYSRISLMPPSFFNADWRYLEKPDNQEHDLFDPLKRIHLGDNWLFTTGGEFRVRYINEVDSRLTGRDNTYELYRTRVYGDLWFQDRFRIYAEFLDAQSFNQDLAPLVSDIDRSDMLNFFIDLKLAELNCAPVYLRAGRQELTYGSQRLISPPDWLNTRRTFEGVKVFRHGEKLDVDAFVVQPVIPDRARFDSVDNNQVFGGLWTTYRPKEGRNIDLYYLALDNASNPPARLALLGGPYNVHTLGARHVGQECNLLWDFEGMYQFGDRRGAPINAFAGTAAVGYVFKDAPMTPQVWIGFDHASGDSSPNAGQYNTFNQLFPFGHYYFGFIDVVGRQNINDFNGQFAFYPTHWLTCVSQAHWFRLDEARDALYNAAGVPIRRDPTGRAGTDVGQEIDLFCNVHIDKHQDVLIGYSHLFAGDFIKATGSGRSPDYTYVQYSIRW